MVLQMWPVLLGTAGSWLLFDIVVFGTSMYTTELFAYDSTWQSTVTQLQISVMHSPTVVLAVMAAERFQLRNLQVRQITCSCRLDCGMVQAIGLLGLGAAFMVLALFGSQLSLHGQMLVFGECA